MSGVVGQPRQRVDDGRIAASEVLVVPRPQMHGLVAGEGDRAVAVELQLVLPRRTFGQGSRLQQQHRRYESDRRRWRASSARGAAGGSVAVLCGVRGIGAPVVPMVATEPPATTTASRWPAGLRGSRPTCYRPQLCRRRSYSAMGTGYSPMRRSRQEACELRRNALSRVRTDPAAPFSQAGDFPCCGARCHASACSRPQRRC